MGSSREKNANLIPSLFKLDDALTSCKNSENFYLQFQRKTTDKQTNRQTDEVTVIVIAVIVSAADSDCN